jgi:outer membrane protein assembly factor BamB
VVGALLLRVGPARGKDWPEFRGPNRESVWNEAGTLSKFPAEGLKVSWRVPVGAGHSSPIVAHGRVFVTDCQVTNSKPFECIHCFDEKSGKSLWTYWDTVDYPASFDPKIPAGPCPTPIVARGRIFSVGATGNLLCLDSAQGTLQWRRVLSEDYNLGEQPNVTACPLVEGGLLIVVVGGKPGACVVAFDQRTGRELWRALDDPPRAFSSPLIISAAGMRQLIVWTPKAVTSLAPATGKTWWREDLVTPEFDSVATPVRSGDRLLLSGLMFELERDKPGASVRWPESKALSQRLLSNTCMPMILGDFVYGGNMSGHFVCLNARTGEQLWQTDQVTGLGHGTTMHLTRNGDSALIFTDQGNLIRAKLSPAGYQELSRVHLIDPDFQFGARKVVWAPLAFAHGCVFARNERELICASLKNNR